MIVTNQLRTALSLALKHNVSSFYTSDSRRQIHKINATYKMGLVQGANFLPTKLGKLSRDENKSGKAFLIVTEENATYHYIVE